MSTDIQTTSTSIIERVMLLGDLGQLKPEERVSYYMRTCESLGLNPMTRPFEYITLNGKLTLYARKDAADQLRKIHNVSIDKPDIQFHDGLIIVTVAARDNAGRTDSDVGVVKETDMRGDVANAIMKAITKAKRRVTLSICGLGMLDETEVETIPDARPFVERKAPMPQSAAIPPAAPPDPTLDNTIDGLVERAQLAITAMQEHGKQPGPKQVEALREAWSTVWSTAAEKGLEVEPLSGSPTPLMYAEGIVRVGRQIIEAEPAAQ